MILSFLWGEEKAFVVKGDVALLFLICHLLRDIYYLIVFDVLYCWYLLLLMLSWWDILSHYGGVLGNDVCSYS